MTSPGFIVLWCGSLIAFSGLVLYILSDTPIKERWTQLIAVAGLVVIFLSINMIGIESRYTDPTAPTEVFNND